MKFDLWRRFSVELSIKNRIVGGIPTDPELIKGWIEANVPAVDEAQKEKLAAATLADVQAHTDEKSEKMWTTFKKDSLGPYTESRCVKAMLKEAANVLRELLIKEEAASKKADAKAAGTDFKAEKSRYTNLKAKLAERLFVEDEIIHILRDGKVLAKVDGDEERPIHVITAQGPRSALKKVDFIKAPAVLKFNVRFLKDGVIDEDLLRTLFEYSGYNGFGSDRSQGNGLFELTALSEIKPLEKEHREMKVKA